MKPIEAYGYFLVNPEESLARQTFTINDVSADDVVVKVSGCGLCHTDLGYYAGQVKTVAQLPLVLGHEISGQVVAAGSGFDNLMGKSVIIPATLPCGECDFCKNGRSNICRNQKMPGNDFNGGFASHITVPARFLCELPADIGEFKLPQLSIVADAVTTPYQSLQRSNLKQGDLAIVIGVGGIGTYMVQHAKNAGATVIAMDVDDQKLDTALKMGASHRINSKDQSERDLKNTVRGMVKEQNLPKHRWKVFETSGTSGGQQTAFSLLSFAGTVGIIGFTMDKVSVRLSNIMAFDADIFGNWGCKPEYYPEVVAGVLRGDINVLDNIEEHSLDDINDVIPLALAHKLEKRVIFLP